MQKIYTEESLAEDKKITKKDIVQVVDQIEQGNEEKAEEARITNQALDHQENGRNEKEIREIKETKIKNLTIKNAIQGTDQTDEGEKNKIKEEGAPIVDKEAEEESVPKKGIKENDQIETMTAPVQEKTKRESEVAS